MAAGYCGPGPVLSTVSVQSPAPPCRRIHRRPAQAGRRPGPARLAAVRGVAHNRWVEEARVRSPSLAAGSQAVGLLTFDPGGSAWKLLAGLHAWTRADSSERGGPAPPRSR